MTNMLASKEAQIGGIPAEALMPTNQNSHVPNRKWSKNSGMDSISISLDSTKNNNDNDNNDNDNNDNNAMSTTKLLLCCLLLPIQDSNKIQ